MDSEYLLLFAEISSFFFLNGTQKNPNQKVLKNSESCVLYGDPQWRDLWLYHEDKNFSTHSLPVLNAHCKPLGREVGEGGRKNKMKAREKKSTVF
jgi:hypothetical protein